MVKEFWKSVNIMEKVWARVGCPITGSYPLKQSQNWELIKLRCLMATWRFNVITKLSHTNSVQDRRKHRKCEHFLSNSNYSKCLPLDLTFSPNPYSKTRYSLTCSAENIPMFSPVRLLIRKLYLASDEAFRKALCIAPRRDIVQTFFYCPQSF